MKFVVFSDYKNPNGYFPAAYGKDPRDDYASYKKLLAVDQLNKFLEDRPEATVDSWQFTSVAGSHGASAICLGFE